MTEYSILILYICALFGLSYKCINVYIKKEYRKVRLINHDCLTILMLLCIMLYIMLAYLMLFAALSNAVCLYDAFFIYIFAIEFCKMLFVSMLCLGLLTHCLFISCTVILNCCFFPNSMFTPFFYFFIDRAMCSLVNST